MITESIPSTNFSLSSTLKFSHPDLPEEDVTT